MKKNKCKTCKKIFIVKGRQQKYCSDKCKKVPFLKYRKQYYLKNKTKIDARNKKWHQTHREQFKKYRHKYYLKHPDLNLWNNVKNRCKYKNIELKFTKPEFLKWYNSRDKKCEYCGILETNWPKTKDTLLKIYKRLQLDRKIPGKAYSLDNLVLACPRCNCTKSNFFTFKEMKKIGRIINESRKFTHK